LVSRIGRIIGRVLNLNTDLIEAIAVGHDIGHTPFGHKGEEFLNEIYHRETGRFFNHNVHSVRILDKMTSINLSLQTLDGILCHCGEKVSGAYHPQPRTSFKEFDVFVERCYTDPAFLKDKHPGTLEGCVVRVSDLIAYLGKDQQDARRIGMSVSDDKNLPVKTNTDVINFAVTNILKNSIDKPYIKLDAKMYESLEALRKLNNEEIYQNPKVADPYYTWIKPMMEKMFYKLLSDVSNNNSSSPIFKHHINNKLISKAYPSIKQDPRRVTPAEAVEVATDYIASMTDDYFIDLFRYLFADDELCNNVKYTGYFD
jgi:dGTPase